MDYTYLSSLKGSQLPELAEKIQSIPLEEATPLVYYGCVAIMASGHIELAYQGFLKLTKGDFKVSCYSSFAHPVGLLIPALCYSLKRPCPSIFSQPVMSFSELEAYIDEKEEYHRRCNVCSDRWSHVDMPTGDWSEALINEMTVSDKPQTWRSSPEKSRFLQELHRLISKDYRKKLNKQGIFKWLQIVEKLFPNRQIVFKWLHIFEKVSPIWQPNYNWHINDYVEEEILLFGVLIYLYLDDTENADRYIKKWSLYRADLVLLSIAKLPEIMERIAKGALKEVTQVSQEQAQAFLAAIDKKQEVSISSFVPQVEDWKALLEKLNQKILEEQQREYGDVSDDGGYYPDSLKVQSCLKAGATEQEITDLEQRLNTTLPLSYKNFLRASNGFIGYPLNDLYGTDQIGWLLEKDPMWEDAADWEDEEDESSDEEYFLYGEHQDTLSTRSRYIKTALQISDDEECNVYLLNPEIIDARNEWEAWDYGSKILGANRYRSFWEMVKATVDE